MFDYVKLMFLCLQWKVRAKTYEKRIRQYETQMLRLSEGRCKFGEEER